MTVFRALMFVSNNFGGVVPKMDLTEDDKNFIALINKELKSYIDDNEKMRWVFFVCTSERCADCNIFKKRKEKNKRINASTCKAFSHDVTSAILHQTMKQRLR